MAEIHFGDDEQGLQKGPFLLGQAGAPSAAPSPTVAATTPGGGKGPKAGPQLENGFEAKFEAAKAEFLKSNKIDVTKPAVANAWKPLIDARARDVVDAGTQEATRWIDEVLTQMDQQIIDGQDREKLGPGLLAFALNDCLQGLLQKHFKANRPDEMDQAVIAIEDKLKRVRDDQYGINSGRVTYSYGGMFCIKNRPAYTPTLSQTTTHLCPMLFNQNAFIEYPGSSLTLAHALIHESLHRIEGLPDKAYEDDRNEYERLSLGAALVNPDSYASFVRDAFKCPKQTTLKDVFFDFNSATLNEQAKRVLNEDIVWLQAYPNVKIRLEGHADERGSASYNLALGDRRAVAVRDYLNDVSGIRLSRMTTYSWGASRPFAPGHGEWAWRFNRRVHFVVVG